MRRLVALSALAAVCFILAGCEGKSGTAAQVRPPAKKVKLLCPGCGKELVTVLKARCPGCRKSLSVEDREDQMVMACEKCDNHTVISILGGKATLSCPTCGKPMQIRASDGKVTATCPVCKKPMELRITVTCPLCGKSMSLRNVKGKTVLSCPGCKKSASVIGQGDKLSIRCPACTR